MRAVALALLLAAAPALAEPVSLRRHVAVRTDVVTLGDLFAETTPELAARRLGPAPAPGQRWVLEAQQLSLIARDNGLAWRPSSPEDRMMVERPGRALSRDAISDALVEALSGLGAPPSLEPDLTGLSLPSLPEEAPEPRLIVEGARYDQGSRRFSANLLVVADGMAPLRMPLAGRMVAIRSVVVATRALAADTLVGPADVATRRLPGERVGPGAAENISLVVGRRLRRAVQADRPVPLADVVPDFVVRKDGAVLLVHDVPGLAITAQGRAQEDGARGGIVPVLNLATGTVVHAEVTGPGRARPLGPALPAAPSRGAQIRAADATGR